MLHYRSRLLFERISRYAEEASNAQTPRDFSEHCLRAKSLLSDSIKRLGFPNCNIATPQEKAEMEYFWRGFLFRRYPQEKTYLQNCALALLSERIVAEHAVFACVGNGSSLVTDRQHAKASCTALLETCRAFEEPDTTTTVVKLADFRAAKKAPAQ